MQIVINDKNYAVLKGRITRVRQYSSTKTPAANVTIAVDCGTNKDGSQVTQYFNLKSFKKDEWPNWKVGMLVECYYHLSAGSYGPEDDKKYSQDCILDYVLFLESKSVVESREAAKADNA